MPDIGLFLIAAVILTLTPGPDNIYVLTRGIAQGRKAALVSACGFSSGLLVHTLLAVLGFAALMQAHPVAYMALKYAGAVYLMYLGWRMWRSVGTIVVQTKGANIGLSRIYWQSVIANVLNPKVTLFFIAFLPQFVNVQAGNTVWQMSLLAALFIAQSIVIFGGIALFSGMIGAYLQRSVKTSSYLNRLAGCAFIALGIRIALPD